MSDGWRGYDFLRRAGYLHSTYIHERRGAYRGGRVRDQASRDAVTTNRIENTWNELKYLRNMYSGSIPAEHAEEFINELVFRRLVKKKCWNLRK